MRIGCIQFAPVLGEVEQSMTTANLVLEQGDTTDVDLLVLPELAFTGMDRFSIDYAYEFFLLNGIGSKFPSLNEIHPYLEPSEIGNSSNWAKAQALHHGCDVLLGYPEKQDPTKDNWPENSPQIYNSAILFNDEGEVILNARKKKLSASERWATPGELSDFVFLKSRGGSTYKTLVGISTDLWYATLQHVQKCTSIFIVLTKGRPDDATTPEQRFEFANHALDVEASILILCMAWEMAENNPDSEGPDMSILCHWVLALRPIINARLPREIIVIFGNRVGEERETRYGGSSAVLGIRSGEVRIYGVLGSRASDLLVVDTNEAPPRKLRLVARDRLVIENGSNRHIPFFNTPELSIPPPEQIAHMTTPGGITPTEASLRPHYPVPWTELTGDYVDRQAVLAASPELQAAINRHRTAPNVGERNQTQGRDDGMVNRGRERQEDS